MWRILSDLRYALRSLRLRAGFAAVTIVILGLAIGATTAIFSILDRALLRSLPYPEPDRLVIVWENDRIRETDREAVSDADYLDFLDQQTSFEHLAARRSGNWTLTGDGDPERLSGLVVTPNYFQALGVGPLAGRSLTPEDGRPGSDPVVLLNEGLWEQRFGADPEIIGRTVVLDGVSRTVIGIMPDEARLPSSSESIWIPLKIDPGDLSRGVHNLITIGRLRSDRSLEAAQADMSTIMARLEQAYPDDNLGRGAFVARLHDELVRNTRPALLILMGAVGLVLLIACANVAGLMMARATGREREIAIRTAMGAGRGRLIQQLLTESAVLALLGGALGLALAYWGVDLLAAIAPVDIIRLEEAGIDGRVLGFALSVSLLTGLAFGLLPALRASQPSLTPMLKEGGRSSTAAAGRQRLRQMLVVAEVALAVVLVIGSGLLIRSFWGLLKTDPGYNPEEAVAMSVQLPRSRYPSPEGFPRFDWPEPRAFTGEVTQRLTALPGVRSAAYALNSPQAPGWTTRVTVVGRPIPPDGEQDEARYRPISAGYFETLQIPLKRGRTFDERDRHGAPMVAIVNESFVRKYFPDEDPIGHSINIFQVPREIVGVVGDVKYRGLTREVQPSMYVPFDQHPWESVSFVVRTAGDPTALIPSLQRAIWEIDPDLAVFNITPLEHGLSSSLSQQRFTMALLVAFAVIALLLAALGIYGVISYFVTERQHEVGIRMALGARRADVLSLVLRQGLVFVTVGTILGVLAALGTGRLLSSLLFGVSALDPLTLVSVPVILTAVAALACYLPARRAARVDPVATLRYE